MTICASVNETFVTSDFDLSTFDAYKIALGISLEPLFGIAQWKQKNPKKFIFFKAIDARYAYYERSDGLNVWVAAIDLKFNIQHYKKCRAIS